MFEGLAKIVDPKIAFAIIILLTILNIAYTAFTKFFFERRLKNFDAQQAEKLKLLENQLARSADAEKAQRDYEYEARKHLYAECKPLIFQFVELSEDALYRIHSLARASRQGYLPQWLVSDEYYLASTMYQLIAPLVIYKFMRRRLTTVDLTLDSEVDVHYQLAKHLSWSFTGDFEFAWGLRVHELTYDPNNQSWQRLRQQHPAVYWRQGIPIGRFDNAVEALIVREPEPATQRVMSFGEFESSLHTKGSPVANAFAVVKDIFSGFDPERRPVLWRMLVAQAHIYDAMLRFHREQPRASRLVVTPIAEDRRAPFYWRQDRTPERMRVLNEPFDVAEAYLEKWLKSPLFDSAAHSI